jgi:tetratricopeptide (TPR) repeat protein
VQIVFALIWFFYRRGYFIEGLTWAERILASPALQEPSPLRALAQQNYGILAVWKGEQDKGLAQIEESLAVLIRTEEAQWFAPSLISKAVALINMGRDLDAQPLLVQAQKLFKEMGFDYFQVIALVHLGNVELGLGHPEQALNVLEKARVIARSLNEPWILSFVLNNLGEVARTQGRMTWLEPIMKNVKGCWAPPVTGGYGALCAQPGLSCPACRRFGSGGIPVQGKPEAVPPPGQPARHR